MYCILCGEHLYKEITWRILFKLNYVIHPECEEKLENNIDFIAIPFMDKIILYDYLFIEKNKSSNDVLIFLKFGVRLFEKAFEDNRWSIMLFIDVGLDDVSLVLVTKLVEAHILFVSIFNKNFI